MYYRWLLGNSLAHVEGDAEGVAAAEGARMVLGEVRGALGRLGGLWVGIQGWLCARRGIMRVRAAARPWVASPGSQPPSNRLPPSITSPPKVLQREVGRFEADHLASDPDARWPLLMVARLREAQARLGLAPQVRGATAGAACFVVCVDGATTPLLSRGSCLQATPTRHTTTTHQSPNPTNRAQGESSAAVLAEVKAMYLKLCRLDPMRAGYYRDAAEGRAFVVVQALGTV
jgi:geranylgeranyl transferase type-2 subunit alpha